jgi:hypothetical protein
MRWTGSLKAEGVALERKGRWSACTSTPDQNPASPQWLTSGESGDVARVRLEGRLLGSPLFWPLLTELADDRRRCSRSVGPVAEVEGAGEAWNRQWPGAVRVFNI